VNAPCVGILGFAVSFLSLLTNSCIELGKVSLDLIQRHCTVFLRSYKDLRFFLYNKITSWVILIESYLHHRPCFGVLVYRELKRETLALANFWKLYQDYFCRIKLRCNAIFSLSKGYTLFWVVCGRFGKSTVHKGTPRDNIQKKSQIQNIPLFITYNHQFFWMTQCFINGLKHH